MFFSCWCFHYMTSIMLEASSLSILFLTVVSVQPLWFSLSLLICCHCRTFLLLLSSFHLHFDVALHRPLPALQPSLPPSTIFLLYSPTSTTTHVHRCICSITGTQYFSFTLVSNTNSPSLSRSLLSFLWGLMSQFYTEYLYVFSHMFIRISFLVQYMSRWAAVYMFRLWRKWVKTDVQVLWSMIHENSIYCIKGSQFAGNQGSQTWLMLLEICDTVGIGFDIKDMVQCVGPTW